MNVVAIAGSLRVGSYNTMALRAAQSLAPPGMRIDEADISQVPLYNDDINRAGSPEAVSKLRDQLRNADAVLLVTPEYNFSVPGVLKNALDWISRPPHAPLEGKPVAVLGASIGPLGTARAQYHLRQVLQCMGCFTVARPEVFIGGAASKFDAAGTLTDEATGKFIRKLLEALQQLTTRLEPSQRDVRSQQIEKETIELHRL